jgi:hypothetical protein
MASHAGSASNEISTVAGSPGLHSDPGYEHPMFKYLALKGQKLLANAPDRVKWQIGTAVVVVGLLLLLKSISATNSQPSREVARPTGAAPGSEATGGTQSQPATKTQSAAATNTDAAVVLPPDAHRSMDPELERRVYLAFPELDSNTQRFQQLNDLDKVIRLREFSYRHTAFAADRNQKAYRAGTQMIDRVVAGKSTLAEAYDFFSHAQGGVLECEAAELLMRLYASFGFESFVLKCGSSPAVAENMRPVHAVTLVRINIQDTNGEERSILSPQDPSLNVGYVGSHGQPIDYFEMLSLLAERKAEQIHLVGQVQEGASNGLPVTVAFSEDLEKTVPSDFERAWYLGESPVWSHTANGSWISKNPRTIWSFERVGDVAWKSKLYRLGFPPESIYMHCFPLQISGGAEGPSLHKKAWQTITEHTNSATQSVGTAAR